MFSVYLLWIVLRNSLPLYLRFIRGVVDSSDLSLNVSREILQKDARVEAMKSAVTRRALDMLRNWRKMILKSIRNSGKPSVSV